MVHVNWDERYAAGATWGDVPNLWVVQHVAPLPVGTALDLAAGDGRHARWLADRGWQVLAVDISVEAAFRGARRTHDASPGTCRWVVADATRGVLAPASVDLLLVAYLHLPHDELRKALARAAATVRPGGTAVVVGHDVRNLREGVGGPQDEEVLTSPALVSDVLGVPGWQVSVSEVAARPVEGSPRSALDTVVVARRRPSSRPEYIPPGV